MYSHDKVEDSLYDLGTGQTSGAGVFESLFRSTSVSTSLLLSALGHVLALLSLAHALDCLVVWAAGLLGAENVGLGYLLGTVAQPFVWFLGLEWRECQMVRLV